MSNNKRELGPILSGDIGGTKTILALVDTSGPRPKITARKKFINSRYNSHEEILESFIASTGGADIHSAVLGVAGRIDDGRCRITNLDWTVDSEKLGQDLGIAKIWLINDLEAMGHGLSELSEGDILTLRNGKDLDGNAALIAAGTGLGETFILGDSSRRRTVPIATEAGHADFAPRNEIEVGLMNFLNERYGRASLEGVLSGPGLLNIYLYLKELRGAEEGAALALRMDVEDPVPVIVEESIRGRSLICREATDIFLSALGAEAGNLALRTLASGGIYIGGGLGPAMLTGCDQGTFIESFLKKSPMSDFLSNIPVYIILNDEVALIGAARYGVERNLSVLEGFPRIV